MSSNIKTKKRIRNLLIILVIVLLALIIRVGVIQFIDGERLETMALEQQALDRKVSAKRGTIYDATGKNILAVSSSVETVTVNPTNIKKEDKEKLARVLSDIFELEYETVLKKVSKRSSIETIVRKVDKEKTDQLRIWLKENEISVGVNIDEDSKRYYPYNNLASQIIGFTGSDNQGLDGLEAKYDSILKGDAGKITKVTDAVGGEIKDENEDYISPTNGKDIVLSIDVSIQSIVEKYLEEVCIDNNCTDGGNVIVMNPNTGDVLAMATYPGYNLNEPYTINRDDLLANWDSLSQEEKTKNLQQMWRNKAIADTYEPGSTFKLITTSASLEEGIVKDIDKTEFGCSGSITIAGTRIKCWRYYRPHGSESLRMALMNSCNPVFIGLGQKLGVKTYYKYLDKFGLLDTTGIDLPGEANSIFLKEEKVGPVELATISFGQRFEITPIQLITAVSSIANGGELVKPRVVTSIIDSETGEVEEIKTETKGRVISEENSKKVLDMMHSVVAEGTGKNAQVSGFTVGGKTGTSEDGVNTGKYVTSFIGVAPISSPEVVVLVTLYNPVGEGGHQGGAVAAPVGGQILTDVLAYLELEKDDVSDDEVVERVMVPDIRGLSISEAKKTLKEKGLNLEIKKEQEVVGDEKIKNQIPVSGIEVNKDSTVYFEV